jgi:hypothetical protein
VRRVTEYPRAPWRLQGRTQARKRARQPGGIVIDGPACFSRRP